MKNLGIYMIAVILFFAYCSLQSKEDQVVAICDDIAEIIISNSELKPDTVITTIQRGSVVKSYVKHDKILKKEYYTLDTITLAAITRYGPNEKFEMRNKISTEGRIMTNGILFEGDYYGLWHVYYENTNIRYTGYRYKDVDFGDWTYFEENGRIDRIILKNNERYFDSILVKLDR